MDTARFRTPNPSNARTGFRAPGQSRIQLLCRMGATNLLTVVSDDVLVVDVRSDATHPLTHMSGANLPVRRSNGN